MEDDRPFGIIYRVTNKINDKIYIGQTIKELSKRKSAHESKANNPASHFHKAIRLYGKESFIWEVVEECNSKEEMDLKETFYIKQYDSINKGYNMTSGGEGTINRVCGLSTREKISRSKIGKPLSAKHKELLSSMRRGKSKSKSHILSVAESKSKVWKITFPDLHVETIRNLSKFCRTHHINDNGMRLVANGSRKHHKGFKCEKVSTIAI